MAEGPDPPARWLKSAQVIYLQVGYDEAMPRVGGDEDRPMLARPDLAATYQRRLGLYADMATLTVATDGRRPEAISQDILAQLAPEPAAAAVHRTPGRVRSRCGLFLSRTVRGTRGQAKLIAARRRPAYPQR